MWTLEEVSTTIPRGDGREFTVNPGIGYPAGYVGSKYAVRRVGNRYTFSLKSYAGNYVEANQMPRNLISCIRKYKPTFSGTLRIRWNGDTILAPQNGEPPIYLGKMRYDEGAESIFPGLNLCEKRDGIHIYAGPQSFLDIGESWSVPAYRSNDRPKLIRRFRYEGERERIKTFTEHQDLTGLAVYNFNPNGKRFYFTNFGQIITPLTLIHIRPKGIDLQQELKKVIDNNLDNAARFIVGKIERTNMSFGVPWVMFVVGNVQEYGGPQLDLSTGPEYDNSDENSRSEDED